MRVLVCGGRDFGCDKFGHYDERRFIFNYLDCAWTRETYSVLTIIQGGAEGADNAAKDWADMNYIACWEFPANWPKYGKPAGFLRNKRMLLEGKPDLVIAFPGGKGTANMVRLAKEAGVEVVEVKYEKPV
jgi:hypothetical protein